jgi:hypothetical protein
MNKQNPQPPLQRKDKFTPKVSGKSQESDLSEMVGKLDRNILHRVWFGGIPGDFEALCHMNPNVTDFREVCWLDSLAWQKWNDKLQAEGGPGAVVIGEAALVTREGRDSGTNKDLNLSHDQRLIQGYVSQQHCFSLGYLDGRKMSVLFINFDSFIEKVQNSVDQDDRVFYQLYRLLISKLNEHQHFQYAKAIAILSIISLLGGFYADWDIVLRPTPKSMDFFIQEQLSQKSGLSFAVLQRPISFLGINFIREISGLASTVGSKQPLRIISVKIPKEDFTQIEKQFFDKKGEFVVWDENYRKYQREALKDPLFVKSLDSATQARITRYAIQSATREEEIAWLFDFFDGTSGHLKMNHEAGLAKIIPSKMFSLAELIQHTDKSFSKKVIRNITNPSFSYEQSLHLCQWATFFNEHNITGSNEELGQVLSQTVFRQINGDAVDEYFQYRRDNMRFLESLWILHLDKVIESPNIYALFKYINQAFFTSELKGEDFKTVEKKWIKADPFLPINSYKVAKLSSLRISGSHSHEPLVRNVRRGLSKFQKACRDKLSKRKVQPLSDIERQKIRSKSSGYAHPAGKELYELLSLLPEITSEQCVEQTSAKRGVSLTTPVSNAF